MSDWVHIGTHRCRSEPDLFVMEINGPASLAELVQILALQDKVYADCPYALTLCDARNAELPGPEVRRELAEHGKRLGQNIRYSVIITKSAILRTVLLLIDRAAYLLFGQPSAITFVGSEEAAFAWIARRRQARENKNSAS